MLFLFNPVRKNITAARSTEFLENTSDEKLEYLFLANLLIFPQVLEHWRLILRHLDLGCFQD